MDDPPLGKVFASLHPYIVQSHKLLGRQAANLSPINTKEIIFALLKKKQHFFSFFCQPSRNVSRYRLRLHHAKQWCKA
jgi:hypothetical protein